MYSVSSLNTIENKIEDVIQTTVLYIKKWKLNPKDRPRHLALFPGGAAKAEEKQKPKSPTASWRCSHPLSCPSPGSGMFPPLPGSEYSSLTVMGTSAAMVFSALGATYGIAKSSTGIAAMLIMRPELIMKSITPVVMMGIIAIYGLVVAVLIANSLTHDISLLKSFLQLGSGLNIGLSGLAPVFAIGIVGDAGVWGMAHQPRLFVGMILIFAKVLGLYGLIVALILSTRG